MKDFLFFKSIIQRFPETYLSKMKHIYIVNSGLRVKVMEKLSFGLLNNFILGKVVHIEKYQLADIESNKSNNQKRLLSTPNSNSITRSCRPQTSETKSLKTNSMAGKFLSTNFPSLESPLSLSNLFPNCFQSLPIC